MRPPSVWCSWALRAHEADGANGPDGTLVAGAHVPLLFSGTDPRRSGVVVNVRAGQTCCGRSGAPWTWLRLKACPGCTVARPAARSRRRAGARPAPAAFLGRGRAGSGRVGPRDAESQLGLLGDGGKGRLGRRRMVPGEPVEDPADGGRTVCCGGEGGLGEDLGGRLRGAGLLQPVGRQVGEVRGDVADGLTGVVARRPAGAALGAANRVGSRHWRMCSVPADRAGQSRWDGQRSAAGRRRYSAQFSATERGHMGRLPTTAWGSGRAPWPRLM